MATIEVLQAFKFNLRTLSASVLLDADFIEGSGSQYVASFTDFSSTTLYGHGLRYVSEDDPTFTAGTITRVVETDENLDDAIYIWGLSISATALMKAANTPSRSDEVALFIAELQGRDIIRGNAASDKIEGFGGNDSLFGEGGGDTILGGAGNDKIVGGASRDRMTGDAGADDFIYKAPNDSGRTSTTRDVITDFKHNLDDVDLSFIDANGVEGGSPAFKFLAQNGATFTGAGAEVRWYHSGSKTLVEADIDGNRKADFQIELTGHITLSKGDFLL